jgi:hypothetical protein
MIGEQENHGKDTVLPLPTKKLQPQDTNGNLIESGSELPEEK